MNPIQFSAVNKLKTALQRNIESEKDLASINVWFDEAYVLMSKNEFDDYLASLKALFDKKQNITLIQTFAKTMPNLSRLTSDGVTLECYKSLDTLSQWLGSERLIQYISGLPAIADRLRSNDAMLVYFSLVTELATTAPRCLNVFLLRADRLLASVSIGGLRYWALIGAKTHAHENNALNAYFTLTSTESKSIFQRQRPGVLLVDVQRHLQFYLRAIWNQDFFIRPRITLAHDESDETDVVNSQHHATIEGMTLFLPDALDSSESTDAKVLYRAMAAHCAAQLKHGQRRPRDDFSEQQRFCIGLVEDARVEYFAIQEFSGLKTLWLSLISSKLVTSSFECFLQKLAKTLLTLETPCTDNPIVVQCFSKFREVIEEKLPSEQRKKAEALGCWLAEEIETTFKPGDNVTLQLSELYTYRDDNQSLWVDRTDAFDEWQLTMAEQVQRHVNVMEMVNEIDCELADDDAQEIWRLESEFFRDGDPENVSMNELEGRHQISAPFYYSEWDYTANSYRPNWVTLTERSVTKSTNKDIDSLLRKHKTLQRKLRAVIEALQPKGLIRLRKQYEGDSLDLDAAIEAIKEIRRGSLPDMNIDQRLIRQDRSLSVLVLLDLSQSTMEKVSGRDDKLTVLDIAKEATAILAGAVDEIGDPFAIHGFSSNGRSDVQYQRVKDFDEDYDDSAKARLVGLKAGLSTRMGSALRHAKTFLSQQPQRKKLLLLLSDGEPADIDVRDSQYLHADTKKAVDELNTEGIIPFCLTIDPNADDYVSQVFGKGHYSVLDGVEHLPEVLPSLFASLTRGAH